MKKAKYPMNEAKLRNMIRQMVKEELQKANQPQSNFSGPSQLEQEYKAYQEFLRKQQEEMSKNPWGMFGPQPTQPQHPKTNAPSQWPKGFDPDFEF